MKKILLHIVLSLCICFSAFSQLATSPNFHANVVRGCAPLTITLINDYTLDGGGGALYDFTGNPFTSPNPVHTYTLPGIYTVRQFLSLSQPLPSSIQVEVLATPKPNFSVSICKDREVTVNIYETIYDKYIIDFGDGKKDTVNGNVQNTITHAYTDLLDKTIQVTGNYIPTASITSPWCGASTSKVIKLLDKIIRPDITALIVDDQSSNGIVTLVFNAMKDQRYILQQKELNSSTYTTIVSLKNLSGTPNYPIKSLNTQSKQYCFQLISYDDCGKRDTSDEACTIINNVQAVNNQNNISWEGVPPATLKDYDVLKNTTPINAGTVTSYPDKNIVCGEYNCYVVVANVNKRDGTILQSISDTSCVTAISTTIPPVVQNFNSSYSNQQITLSWDKPNAGIKSYSLKRRENSNPLKPYATFKEDNYTDAKVSVNNQYCYQIDYLDNCTNSSPSSTISCPVVLTLETDPENVFQNDLTWTSYSGATAVQSYSIEKLDENNNIITTITPSGFKFTDLITDQSTQLIKYRIKVTNSSNLPFSYSNIIEIKFEGSVFAPNAFTPNGDGNNDAFSPKTKFIKDYKLTIFNRWGEVIFSTQELTESWDGTYKGAVCIPDSYAYLIESTDLWKKSIIKRGSITLLK